MEGLASLLPFILIAVVFWFLLIRPQRRRQQEIMSIQRSVGVGDEVMLGAGILGHVAEADEEFLELEVSPGVRLRVARGAVAKVVTPSGYPAPDGEAPPAEPDDPSRAG